MYITYGSNPGPSGMTDGAVWKLNIGTNEWTDVTPDKPDPENKRAFGYAAVSMDATNPENIIVSSFGRHGKLGGDDIFRSTDRGKTWKAVFESSGKYDFSKAPYTERTGIHWLFDIEIDPFNPDHALFTTGYGGYETFDLKKMDENKPTHWEIMSSGIEETVALELASPPKGAQLISAIGDYGGFVHHDLDTPVPEGNFINPHFGNTDGVAFAEAKTDIIVRVGRASGYDERKNIGYSTDGGKTWQPTDSVPGQESRSGFIAVSADGSTWIWTPETNYRWNRLKQPPTLTHIWRTIDYGKTWQQPKGIPDKTRVIADRVNADKFYAIDLFSGKFYYSKNKGALFQESKLNIPGGIPESKSNRGDTRGGQDKLYATPGFEGDLWIAAYDGLYHSYDFGKTFNQLNHVIEIHGFGFGKHAPGSDYPALFLVGVIDGIRGIFRSDNMGENWIKINDDQHQWGLVLHVCGDPKIYGRVYVGTHGRGIFYGDKEK